MIFFSQGTNKKVKIYVNCSNRKIEIFYESDLENCFKMATT